MRKIIFIVLSCSFFLISCEKHENLPTPLNLTAPTRTSEANIPRLRLLEDGDLYFTSANNIYYMSNTMLEGNNQEPVLICQNDPTKSSVQDIAVDIYGNKVYWSDSKKDRIFYANPDGTSVKSWPITNPGRMTIDPIKKKLYWIAAEKDAYFIYRCNLDGTLIEGFMSFNKESGEHIYDIEIPTGSNEMFVTMTNCTLRLNLTTKAITMKTFKTSGYTLDVSSNATGNKVFLNQGEYIFKMSPNGDTFINILSDNKYSSDADIAFHDKKGVLYCASAGIHHNLLKVDESGKTLKEYETFPLDGPMIVVNKN